MFNAFVLLKLEIHIKLNMTLNTRAKSDWIKKSPNDHHDGGTFMFVGEVLFFEALLRYYTLFMAACLSLMSF